MRITIIQKRKITITLMEKKDKKRCNQKPSLELIVFEFLTKPFIVPINLRAQYPRIFICLWQGTQARSRVFHLMEQTTFIRH